MFDVIIVGARCAGAPTAMLLARRGHRVLVVDRGKFPSDIPHGHFIHRGGPARLHRWGLLERILATGCPALDTYLLDLTGLPVVGHNVAVDGVAFGCGPRRKVLDQILIDAAVEAGAEFRPQFVVEDVLADDGRVTGIRGRGTSRASTMIERARLVIGADGRNSKIARIVGATSYESVPPLTCWYFSYWSGKFDRIFAVWKRQQTPLLTWPTSHDQQAIFIGWPVAEFPRIRQDIEGAFMDVVRLTPEFAERVAAGRREDRFYGTADVPNFFRKPFGPGWALVGDAGCHKDPILALGITDALRDAELLSEAVHDGLAGKHPMEEALADYEERRNTASRVLYQENVDAARLMPLPEAMTKLLTALHGREEDIRQFHLARQGLIPAERFFNPDNLRRIIKGA
jgi:flavin-dependent dehydrogenase